MKQLLNNEIITGIMLSDGHISNEKFRNSRMVLGQSKKNTTLILVLANVLKQLGILYYFYEATNSCFSNQKSLILYSERNSYFTKLRNHWYSSQKKIVPKLKLTAKTLAYWYMGDGNSEWIDFKNKKSRITLCTDAFSKKEIETLSKKIKKLGIDNHLKKIRNNRYRITLSKSKDVALFFNLIEKYILPSFEYKIKYPHISDYKSTWTMKKKINQKRISKERARLFIRDSKGRFMELRG